jgi:hypothetical protein
MLRVNGNTHDRLPALSHQELPAVHDEIPGQELAERDIPVHRAHELLYSSWIDRDQAWRMLSESARSELLSRIGGEIVDWMAGDHGNGRVWAIVLGPTGMCTAHPTELEDTWTYTGYRFTPGSLARVRIPAATSGRSGEPPSRTSTGLIPTPSQGAQPSENENPLARYLDPEFCGFLGHLPESIQKLIQEPYAPGTNLESFRWYWNESSATQTTWRFWCYVKDDVTLTFASGYKETSQPANADVKWTVWCHRARIA